MPALGGQGVHPAGSMLRREAESNELTLCSDSDISVGQGSSIMMWWLRRAVNYFELAACLLCCCSRGCSHRELRTCSILGEAVCGVLGRTPTLAGGQ